MQDAVGAVAHDGLRRAGLDVDVGGAGLDRLGEDALGQADDGAVVGLGGVVVGQLLVRADGVEQLRRATLEAVDPADRGGQQRGGRHDRADAAAARRQPDVVEGEDVGGVRARDHEGVAVAAQRQDAVALGDRGRQQGRGRVVDDEVGLLREGQPQLAGQGAADHQLRDHAQADHRLAEPLAAALDDHAVAEGVLQLRLVEQPVGQQQITQAAPHHPGLGRSIGAGVDGHGVSFVTMRRTLMHAVVLAALAVAAAGCEVGLDVAVDVGRDGSGRLGVTVGADAAALAQAAAAGATLADFAGSVRALEDPAWEVAESAAPDGSRTVKAAVAFDDPAALRRLSGELADAVAAPEGRLLEPLAVVVAEETVRVEGAAGLVPGPAVADLGLTPESATALLADSFDYTVRVRLPDPERVLSANATRVDGEDLVWEVAPGAQVAIAAEGVRPRFPWVAVLFGAAAALALAAGAAALLAGGGRAAPRWPPTGAPDQARRTARTARAAARARVGTARARPPAAAPNSARPAAASGPRHRPAMTRPRPAPPSTSLG